MEVGDESLLGLVNTELGATNSVVYREQEGARAGRTEREREMCVCVCALNCIQMITIPYLIHNIFLYI